jgi:hypothetical protein
MTDPALAPTLARHLADVVAHALGHAPPTPALLLHDRASPLARLLAEGYRAALPHAAALDVDGVGTAAAMAAAGALPSGSLVVLVESTRFDVPEVAGGRLRLELFRRGLHVIEHPHVGRVPEAELPVYVDALAYDPAHLRPLGAALKARIDRAARIELHSPHGALRYDGPFEAARLNVGDYAGMAQVGGQFPIGEVFTEPVDLEGVHGTVSIGAFGAADFSVRFPDPPFALQIARGRVVGAPGAPPEVGEILDQIAAHEGEVWVRELGFGLNRAMTRARRLHDVSAYERMCGVHLSLGAKHAVYPKRGFERKKTKFHVDVFAWADGVEIDGEVIYGGEAYRV